MKPDRSKSRSRAKGEGAGRRGLVGPGDPVRPDCEEQLQVGLEEESSWARPVGGPDRPAGRGRGPGLGLGIGPFLGRVCGPWPACGRGRCGRGLQKPVPKLNLTSPERRGRGRGVWAWSALGEGLLVPVALGKGAVARAETQWLGGLVVFDLGAPYNALVFCVLIRTFLEKSPRLGFT